MKDAFNPSFEINDNVDLQVSRQLELLEMSAICVCIATLYCFLVGLAVLWFAFMNGYPLQTVSIWTAWMGILFPICRLYLKRFKEQLKTIEPELEVTKRQFYCKWFRIFLVQSSLLGISLGCVTILVIDVPSFEFKLILVAVIAVMMATNASHQTPILYIYYAYFLFAWGGTLVSMPWVFPDEWPAMFVLGLIHALSILIAAKRVNRFFIRQVSLEQESSTLATKATLAEQEALFALQQKNEFLATASHDLRQPLHALNLNVEALYRLDNEGEHRNLIRDIKSCSRNLTLMFNSLLDLSKLESGHASIELKSIDLNKLLLEMSTPFASDASQRKLDFRLHLPKKSIVIQSDEALVRQIVTNLLQNALRYTKKGGVLLGLQQHQVVKIIVADTGIGISETDQPLIHHPFYRARVGFSQSLDSHGLGLAVVNRCVNILGARHGFKSCLNRGSKFWVTFPLSNSSEQTLTSDIADQSSIQELKIPPLNLSGFKMLIVEDDPIVSQSWRNYLAPTKLNLQIVSNMKETLSAIELGYEPDFVLCDLRLRSGDNGYSILQQVLMHYPMAACALVTGEFNASEIQEAENDGVTVLRKPVSGEQIQQLLKLWSSQA